MVEWASGRSGRTFNQSAANSRNEPILPIFCNAAKVWYGDTNGPADKCSVQSKQPLSCSCEARFIGRQR